ncbi:MAG: hypothetical protein AAF628_13290 [Planctomycetota bacterium]
MFRSNATVSHPADQRRGADSSERGVALVLAILFTVIIGGLVTSGTLALRAHRAKTETNYRVHGQVAQFARAGLIETVGWFRRQTTQPVTVFDPQLDLSASPQLRETLEPDVGIVREFQISGPLWGRYEAWKEWDADPDPQRLAWRQRMQVGDITTESGATGAGNVWRLNSVAYLYRLVDSSKRYDEYPNQVLATDLLGTEIRRLTLAPPGQAAICSRDADNTSIVNSVNIQGGIGAGIFSPSSGTGVSVTGSPTIEGSPGISSTATYDDSLDAVFGVQQADLRILSDLRITSTADFPNPVPVNTLIFVETSTLQFSATKPLVGSAAIYVKGDVDFAANSKSFFSGLLYVDGDLRMRETLEFNGTLICTGNVWIEGQADWINISYDDGALNRLRTEIGQYRMSAAIRRTTSTE